MQKTIAQEITFKGVGLHSGVETILTLKPAAPDSGINFIRSDIASATPIRALYSNVVDTRNCTCLGDKAGNIISTIEHLMAALSIMEIDNVLVEVSAPEMPIMDGSAAPFVEALEKAGLKEQSATRKLLKVLKPVSFEDDKGNKIELLPAEDFYIEFMIEFPSKIVGRQKFSETVTLKDFKDHVAPCRTFCEKYQVDYLRSIGLIKGGSLENAIVLDGETILNEGGFRTQNECVNHKVIDALGDMYTSGYQLCGHLKASKTGHFHNNEILKKLFSDASNYKIM